MLKGLQDQRGMAFLFVLLVMILLASMAIQFAYSMSLSTAVLQNWSDAQRLSTAASSSLAYLRLWLDEERIKGGPVNTPVNLDIPFELTLGSQKDRLTARVEDENAKFNLNSLIYPNGLPNKAAHSVFSRLLVQLGIEQELIDLIEKRLSTYQNNSQGESRPYRFVSLDELLLIEGIDRGRYEKLLPFVTLWSDGKININTAPRQILISLHEQITPEIADRIIEYRQTSPLREPGEITKIPGLEGIGITLVSSIATQGSSFDIHVTGNCSGITREIEAVLVYSGSRHCTYKYWKEI